MDHEAAVQWTRRSGFARRWEETSLPGGCIGSGLGGTGARRRSCAATTATASTGSDAVPSLHLSREVLINWIFS